MKTITIDVLNERVMSLLKELEVLKLIRLKRDSSLNEPATNNWKKYKGAMAKQPLEEIDRQLNDLRSEWQ